MNGTFGLTSSDSLTSFDLQRSLESRLRANLDLNGSPEFGMRWKKRGTPSGPRIFQLAPWERPTGVPACFGWPTPKATEIVTGKNAQGELSLTSVVQELVSVFPWGTPETRCGVRTEKFGKGRALNPGEGLALGITMKSLGVVMGNTGELNPAFPRWLMGFPAAWDDCAPTEMP